MKRLKRFRALVGRWYSGHCSVVRDDRIVVFCKETHWAASCARAIVEFYLRKPGLYHDPLTGLANRRCFIERLEQSLIESERSGQRLAVLFVDLDQFKQV